MQARSERPTQAEQPIVDFDVQELALLGLQQTVRDRAAMDTGAEPLLVGLEHEPSAVGASKAISSRPWDIEKSGVASRA